MSSSPANRRLVVAAGILATLVTVVSVVALYDAPLNGTDLWWHMALGRLVLESGSLQVDHASLAWTDADAPFVYVTWVGDVLLVLAHDLGGSAALNLLQALVYGLIGVLFVRHVRPPARLYPLALVLVLVAFVAMRSSAVIVKNTMFSYSLYGVLMALLLQARRGPAWLYWLLPVLFAVWTNTHGEVLLGVAALGIYTAVELGLALLRRHGALPAARARTLAVAATLCVVALCANPEGWRLPGYWLTKALHASDLPGRNFLSDTVPTYRGLKMTSALGAALATPVWLWLLMSLTAAGRLALVVLRRRWDELAVAVVGVAACALSWTAVRMVPFGVVVWLFTTGPWLFGLVARARPRRWPLPASLAALTVVLAGALAMRVVVYPESGSTKSRLTACVPEDAVRFLNEHELPQPIFNDYITGGYLLWGAPDYPVFIDPRYSPYDPELRQAYFAFEQRPTVDELEALTENSGIRTAVVRHLGWQGRMCTAFQDAPSWQLVYLGTACAVYVHRQAMTPELQTLADTTLDADRFASCDNLHALRGLFRIFFHVDPGESLRLYRSFERNIADHKQLKRLLRQKCHEYLVGKAFTDGEDASRHLPAERVRQRFAMYYLDGKIDIARLVATGYLLKYPDDATMHYNLACVEARAGDLATARRALLEALERGYDRYDQIRSDPDLAALRDAPEHADLFSSLPAAEPPDPPRPDGRAAALGAS